MGTHFDGTAGEIRALDAFIKLMRAANSVRAHLEPHLRSLGMTEKQLGVLEALMHLGPMRQHELGTKLLASRANITLIVDELSRRGLVRRERQADDRRCIRVHLTAEGRRRIRAVFPEHVALIVSTLSSLNAQEQKQLGRLCRKLGLALAEPSAVAPRRTETVR